MSHLNLENFFRNPFASFGWLAPILLMLILVVGCGKSSAGGDDTSASSDEVQAVEAKSQKKISGATQATTVSLSSKEYQSVGVTDQTSSIVGTRALIPPGSLSISEGADSVVLVVEEGNASNLAESAKDLALSANKIQKTGPAIVIRPSAAVAVTGDLVLTIPGPDGLSLVAFELEAGVKRILQILW